MGALHDIAKPTGKAVEMAKRRTRTVELLLEGLTHKKIAETLASEFKLKKSTSKLEITKARTDILEWKNQNINEIIDIHIERYETMFAQANEAGLDMIAMRILKAKEKLIGFHKESRNIQINNNEMMYVNATHEPSKLSPVKQKRMTSLINKMRSNKWKAKNLSATTN